MRKFFAKIILSSLKFPIVLRAISFFAWQRRRHLRDVVESRLDVDGGYPEKVIAGPFSGMQLPPRSRYVDARFEKTFGAYEPELFPLIEELAKEPSRYRTIINIGAADGFFTVGLALRFPAAQVIAFEMQPHKQETLLELARLNGVADRIDLRGRCSEEDLKRLDPVLPALVVCDVDGYEETLLDPVSYPVLSKVDLIIETHDCFVPGITSTLKQRFAPSHEVDEIPMRGVDYTTIPVLKPLTMPEIDALVGSERPSLQSWLMMRSRPV